ncbi:MAG: hypothetical protein KDC95_12935, partial [Planctomycetes bacterium]|nr:hypothetical protein [Planctomycetota bacterium]
AVLAVLADAPRDRDRSHYLDLLTSEDSELREVGAKGVLALATADTADADARDRAREAVGAVLGAGVGVDARIAAWSVLAKVPDESAVTLVRSPAVQPVDARERAAIDAAKLAVAASIESRSEAQALAKEVLDGAKNRGQRQRAAKILVAAGGDIASIARELGCLTSWHIAGPFRGPDEKTFTQLPFATTGIDPTAPLRLETTDGARELPWVAKVSDDIDGVIDLRFVSKESNVSAVAYTVLQCPRAMNAELRFGSDDQIAVWLDGKLVHENFVARGLNVDEDRVAIDLDAGRHELLIEIGQNGGGWEFHARVVPR